MKRVVSFALGMFLLMSAATTLGADCPANRFGDRSAVCKSAGSEWLMVADAEDKKKLKDCTKMKDCFARCQCQYDNCSAGCSDTDAKCVNGCISDWQTCREKC